MILATHAIVGATLAQFFPSRPAEAFVVGFTAHLLADTLPHWDYDLTSRVDGGGDHLNDRLPLKKLLLSPDILKILLDLVLGLVIIYLIFGKGLSLSLETLAGAVGGLLPDLMQMLYFLWPKEPLKSFQRFHTFTIHGKKIPQPVWGIFFQVLFVAIILFLV